MQIMTYEFFEGTRRAEPEVQGVNTIGNCFLTHQLRLFVCRSNPIHSNGNPMQYSLYLVLDALTAFPTHHCFRAFPLR